MSIKKHFCGVPTVSDKEIYRILLRYDDIEMVTGLGPPISQIDSAEVEVTPEWCWMGAADDPKIAVFCNITWKEETRGLRFRKWKLINAVIKVDERSASAWILEDNFEWFIPENHKGEELQ